MKFAVYCIVLLACLQLGTCSTATPPPPATNVKTLTDETFDHDTQAASGATTGDWFVEFYAPWCGHCKALTEKWEELATNLVGHVNVAKVDGTVESAITKRYTIEGFPTLLFFHAGQYWSYQGERTVEAMEAFALGGYKEKADEAKKAKGPPGLKELVEEHYEILVQDFRQMYFYKKNFCGLVFLAGTIFGLLVSKCLGGGGKAKKD